MRVLVVDDEPLARRRLVRMLERMEDVETAGEAEDGESALERIRTLAPDAVLLDIRMPGLDGLTLATRHPDLPPVIFTTAFDEYAVQAFDAAAVDYLLKPVTEERLARALQRARDTAGGSRNLAALIEQLARRPRVDDVPRITARQGDRIRIFDPRHITRFHAADKYTVFHDGSEEFLLDETLTALESRLAEWGFLRVHRGELINLNCVRALRTEDGGTEVELEDGQMVSVSRRSVSDLKRRLGIPG